MNNSYYKSMLTLIQFFGVRADPGWSKMSASLKPLFAKQCFYTWSSTRPSNNNLNCFYFHTSCYSLLGSNQVMEVCRGPLCFSMCHFLWIWPNSKILIPNYLEETGSVRKKLDFHHLQAERFTFTVYEFGVQKWPFIYHWAIYWHHGHRTLLLPFRAEKGNVEW